MTSRRHTLAGTFGATLLGTGLLLQGAPAASATPIVPLPPTSAPGTFTEQNLAADRTSANFFYRIPALAHLGGGVVLASWDARPGSAADAPNPNSIVQRRSTDNGLTWGPFTTIAAGHPADASGPQYGYSDPSYVVDAQAGKVFAFFVYSKDQGFFGSQYGNDDTDRTIISSAVAQSSDGGQTWSTPRLITNIVKPGSSKTNPQPGDIKAQFATSGEGIQLRYGPYAGRLIQQFAGKVKQADGSEQVQAYSVYSDDHGATWVKGANVGTAMDENKTVELSDGRVMLNSRDYATGTFRKVAISSDGGHTYGPVTQDTQLLDPRNNAALTRLFPDAAQGSADAKKLLFTNAFDRTSRVNLTAKVSCDDGQTWPGRRTIRATNGAYSSTTRINNGKIGVLYEADSVSNMPFASFDDAWLNYVCAPVSSPDTTMAPGSTKNLPVTITNQEATTLVGGSATIATPTGWSPPSVSVPSLAPGASTTVTIPLTAPSGASGSQRLAATFTAADGRTSAYDVTVGLTSSSAMGLTVTGQAPTRDVATNPYAVGERLNYTLTVTSTSSVTGASVPTQSNLELNFAPPATPNCRYLTLAPAQKYTCTPGHLVTAADLTRGYFVPTATFTMTSTTDATATTTVNFAGAPVFLRDSATVPLGASITGARTDTSRDLTTSPYAAGEAVPYRFDVTNTSPFTESVTPTAGTFSPLLPPGSGNCRYLNLAPFASYGCSTPRHTVTQSEAEAGFFTAQSTWSVTASGKTSAAYDIDGGEVDLKVRQPDLDGTLTPVWVDVDGDRYASVGDRVDATRTVANSGNVTLTGLTASGVTFSGSTLGLGAALSATQSVVLTSADLTAGELVLPGFSATAANGSKPASVTVDSVRFSLDRKPAQPTSAPTLTERNLSTETSSVDLGLARKYRSGQLVVAQGLDYGQWYYLYINGTGQSLGWHFPTMDNTVEFVLPQGIKNGTDHLVALSSGGELVAFDRIQVTPKGL